MSKKKITAIIADNLRQLIKAINEEAISKEDIVTVLKDDSKYIIIYYK